jgi:hypothetical protein
MICMECKKGVRFRPVPIQAMSQFNHTSQSLRCQMRLPDDFNVARYVESIMTHSTRSYAFCDLRSESLAFSDY